MTLPKRHPDDPNPPPEGDSTGGIIPYKNPCALIAYYCGLFALFPFLGLFLGIAGFVLGIMGLRHRARHPETKGSVHAWIGIIMGGVCAFAWGACLVGILISLVTQG